MTEPSAPSLFSPPRIRHLFDAPILSLANLLQHMATGLNKLAGLDQTETYHAMNERLSDNKALEDLIYWQFYNHPAENARRNLAIVLQRYLRGQPLVTEAEKLRAELDSLDPEARAAYWRNRNAQNIIKAQSNEAK